MTIEAHTDCLIIGGGSMGLATADWLAAQANVSVNVLDAYRPPHDQGAHHGETRLSRLAYGEGAGHVPLAVRALERFCELEAQTGESLFLPTGITNIDPASAPFLRQVAASAEPHGLVLDLLEGSEASKRWSGWRLDETQRVAFEPDAGVLRVERILACWRDRVARSARVTLTGNAPVVAIEPQKASYVARCADGRRFGAERVLLAAGQHVAPLTAPLGVELPLTRVRKTFAWFETDARYASADFAGFSPIDEKLGIYYGFPDIDGAGFKRGRHDGGQPLLPGESLGQWLTSGQPSPALEAFGRASRPVCR